MLSTFNVSGDRNNCGLFALILGIKISLRNKTRYEPLRNCEFLDNIDETSLQRTTEKTKEIGSQLREKMRHALSNDEDYKKKRYNGFLNLCRESLGKESGRHDADMQAFARSNPAYVAELQQNWIKIKPTLSQEFENSKKEYYECLERNVVEVTVVSQVKDRLSQLVSSPPDEKKIHEIIESLYANKGDNVRDLIKQRRLFRAAWLGVKAGEAVERGKLLEKIDEIFYKKILKILEVQDENFKKNLLWFALLEETNFNESGVLNRVSTREEIFSKAISFFIEIDLSKNWNTIYQNYCSYIKNSTEMLTTDELGCLASSLNVRLTIKFKNGSPYESSYGLQLLHVTLCNPSEIHWMVECGGASPALQNNEKIMEIIKGIKDKEYVEYIINAISNQGQASFEDFSYLVGVFSAIKDTPDLFQSQGRPLRDVDAKLGSKLLSLLFPADQVIELNPESIYSLASILKDFWGSKENIFPKHIDSRLGGAIKHGEMKELEKEKRNPMETKNQREMKVSNDAFRTAQVSSRLEEHIQVPYETSGIEFKTEMDAITKTMNHTHVLTLLKKRPRCTREYLDYLLDYCLHYQSVNKDKEMLRLDYAVSRLVGGNTYLLHTDEKQVGTNLTHLSEIPFGLKEKGKRSLRLMREQGDMDEIKNKVGTGREIIILKAEDNFTIFYKSKIQKLPENSKCSKDLEIHLRRLSPLSFNGEILVKDKNSAKIYELAYKQVASKEGYTKRREEKDYTELDVWNEEEFLPHRIRALFKMLYNELKSEVSGEFSTDVKCLRETIRVLRAEILIELETLHICKTTKKIELFNKKNKQDKSLYPEMIECLAKDIYLRVIDLFKKGGQEYALPCGWSKHAIYVNILKYKNQYLIRSDNLGSGARGNHHEIEISERPHYYPHCVLVKNLEDLKIYIEKYIKICTNIISKNDNQERKKALAKLYNGNQLNLEQIKELGYEPSPEQKGDTCTVTSHNVGLKIRMGVIYERFLKWELEVAVDRSQKVVFDKMVFDEFEKEFSTSFLFPPTILEKLQQHCIQKAKIELLFGKKEFPANKFPVVLTYSVREKKEKPLETILEGDKKIIHESLVKQADETIVTRKISSFKILDFFDKNNMQMLVKGDAGMGKSALCKFIMFQCVTNKKYIEQFPLVLPISLRNLNSKNYPLKGHPYTIFDIIFQECFCNSKLSIWEMEKLKEALGDNDFLKKCLWILDGKDELPNLEHLNAVFERLLNMPKSILTSRFDDFQRNNNEVLSFNLEGFSGTVVKKYIKYFFTEEQICVTKEEGVVATENGRKLRDFLFLQSHSNISEIASIPINLELICSIWEQNSAVLINIPFLTITKLYTQITTWLMRRFLKEKEGVKDEVVKDEQRVLRRLKVEIDTIEKIAFHMMKKRTTSLPYEEILDTVPEILDRALCDDLVNIGIFANIKFEKGVVVCPSNFEFMHKSFQEFFAAGYLVKNICSFEPTINSDITSFIQKGKHDQFNNLFFRFSAGRLLEPSVLPRASEVFWKLLISRSQSFNEMNYLVLLLNCLQECNCKTMFQTFPQIDQYLVNYLTPMLNSPLFQRGPLMKAIRDSGNVLSYSNALMPLLRALFLIDPNPRYLASHIGCSGFRFPSTACTLINKSNVDSQQIFKEIIIKQMREVMLRPNIKPFQKKLIDYLIYAGQDLADVKGFISRLLYSQDERERLFGLDFLSLQAKNDLNTMSLLFDIMSGQGCTDNIKHKILIMIYNANNYNTKVLVGLKKFIGDEKDEEIKKKAIKILDVLNRKADFYKTESDDDDAEDKYSPSSSENLSNSERITEDVHFLRDKDVIVNETIKSNTCVDFPTSGRVCSENNYQAYLTSQYNDYKLSHESLKKLTGAEWLYLLKTSLYLEKTPFNELLDFFLNSWNTLVGEMVFKIALKKNITIVCVEEGLLIIDEKGALLIRIEDPQACAVSIDFFKNFIINYMKKHNLLNELAWKDSQDSFKILSAPAHARVYVLPKIQIDYSFGCSLEKNSLFDVVLNEAMQVHGNFSQFLNVLSLREEVCRILINGRRLYFNAVLDNVKCIVKKFLKDGVFYGFSEEFIQLLAPLVNKIYLDYKAVLKGKNKLKELKKDALFSLKDEKFWEMEGWEFYKMKEMERLNAKSKQKILHDSVGQNIEKILRAFVAGEGYQAYCKNVTYEKSFASQLEAAVLAKLLKVRLEVYGDANIMAQSKLVKDNNGRHEFISHLYTENPEARPVVFIRTFGSSSYMLLKPTQLELKSFNYFAFFSDSFMPLLRRQYFLNQSYFQFIRNIMLLNLRQRYQEQIQNVQKTVKHLNEPLKESATLDLVCYESYDQYQFQLLTIRQKYQFLVNNSLDGQLLVKGALLFKYARLPSRATSLVMEYAEEGNLNELLPRTGRDFGLS